MKFWTEYLIENQTAKELIATLDDGTFDDVVCMSLLDATGEDAYQISEIELEEIIIEALEVLLKGRKLADHAVLRICNMYKTNSAQLVDEGIILEWENKFYEGE